MTSGEPPAAAEQPTAAPTPRGSGESVAPGPPRYLAVAKIQRPWGVRGWVKIEVQTDFPQRFEQPGDFLLGDERRPVHLQAGRRVHGGYVIKLAGYDTPEAAAALRLQTLYIPIEQAMPLPAGEYYIYQIVGLEVWTDAGERLGVVSDVWQPGSNDVYVVERGAETVLLPAIKDVILEIDLERRRMLVHLLEGLISS
jgi:16S rRNA processing protein RimM